MSNFLVTGGAGFIGSHIVEALVKRGHFVRVLDDFSSGKRENLAEVSKDIELVKQDISSKDACIKATKGIDVVLHQAALRKVPESINLPDKYNKVNIGGTLNMLKASLQNKVKRFIFASSCSIYGDADNLPKKEDSACQPISPYALSKLFGEYYCMFFSCHYGIETVCLRYFNVFGPRQSLDNKYSVVIPKFIACMLMNKAVPIYGSGRQSRDFVYVEDVVKANMLALKKTKHKNQVFNIASGENYSILELVKVLNNIMGKNIKPRFLSPRQGDLFRVPADISSAKKDLGFYPRVSFIDGLKLTLEHLFSEDSVKKNA